MYKKILATLATSGVLLLSGCSKDKKEQTTNEIISKKEYILTSIDKKEIPIKYIDNGFVIANDKDKVVLFDIFATWCPPCRKSAPMLSSLQQKYKDNLVVIGLTIEDDIQNEKLEEFAKVNGVKYIIANSPQNKLLIYDIVKELNVGQKYPIPLMAIYKDAKLINYYAGLSSEEFIESDIKNSIEAK